MRCKFFISLFIISAKRLQEFSLVSSAAVGRPVLQQYTQAFLERMMFGTLLITLVVYMLYLVEVRNEIFLVTIFPVAYGMFRFLWLIESGSLQTDDPTEVIFRDKPLLASVVIFGVMIICLVILFPQPHLMPDKFMLTAQHQPVS